MSRQTPLVELERVRVEELDEADWPTALAKWRAAECSLDFASSDGSVTVTQDRIDDLLQAERLERLSFRGATFGEGRASFVFDDPIR